MVPKVKTQRVSQIFGIGRTQPTLDFVDVDILTDTPVFISPRALALDTSEWGDGCVALVQSFFQTILKSIKAGNNAHAESLLRSLREPNETHLGLSRGESRGRSLGEGTAHDVWSALSQSTAVSTGLLRDLEDTVLMIHGIGVDIVSDMTTNIIRGPLIAYTQQQAHRYGIPLSEGVPSGPMWDAGRLEWTSQFVQLPMTSRGKLLLVPKSVVRRSLQYNLQEYYRWYILEHLKAEELESLGSLVYLLKDGTPRVNIGDLKEKYGTTKSTVIEQALRNPVILDKYRSEKNEELFVPLDHGDLSDLGGTAPIDWTGLLEAVTSLDVGREQASSYEDAIEALISALFYPDLTNPNPQERQHDGRKRVDITYTNMGMSGFFHWLSKHYSCAKVFVECKNYGNEVSNPELDQLSGRFSPSRGQVGIIVCRQFHDKKLFLERCRDTAKDNRGYIIVLDDDDLKELVFSRRADANFK
ncbi:hypothetical protein GCM10011529_31330 [Polymorphobacter glacialis]|uniref:Restriction endonuclease type IV Mrr domain-containing protein n=1 Tax=Sandarakinorhabdus glacialis TaxID=1614636 RepID=A0A917EDC9_9SPHN|nr:restriction endonuclease [Polymorphobacter glacialis]GGE22480.1 hypothetical protein GCM10011529_31330 [Polymorphobacter glacialis]